MAYRKIYFRIRTDCYSSGWSSDADRAAFKEESRRLFQELGWAVTLGSNGGCDTVAKDQQDLYCTPAASAECWRRLISSLCKSNCQKRKHFAAIMLTAMRNIGISAMKHTGRSWRPSGGRSQVISWKNAGQSEVIFIS